MPDPEGTADLVERREKLSRYLAELPPEWAEVIRCADLLGMTHEETASELGRPVGTVASQLSRARAKLRDYAEASERATALGARRRG